MESQVSYLTQSLSNEIGEVFKAWSAAYSVRYEIPCLNLLKEESETIAKIIQRLGTARTIKLVNKYFQLDGIGVDFKGKPNDWFSRNGHTIAIFDKHLAQLSAASGAGTSMDTCVWVIGYSESGKPLLTDDPSKHPELFRHYERMKWDDWLRSSDAQRLQNLKWNDGPNNIAGWIERWREWEKSWTDSKGRTVWPIPNAETKPGPNTVPDPG